MAFSSVLIANRGEIACRIMRTARRLGLRTIAVFSEADANALHVRLADEALCIGPAAAAQSYLSIEAILAAARASGADCVHPGYGFLSENPVFAQACAASGFAFVGPSAAAIRAMGLKDQAKVLMERAGVPVVPGYHGDRQEPDFLAEEAARIGFPVLVKAVAGGGGKGMRRVNAAQDFPEAFESARREARAAFGNDRVLIEKYAPAPRHVEIQIFADAHGNAVHLFERDCSLQRRHQKVIEEAPAPGMNEDTRAAMGAAAVRAAQAVSYVGAGTVEFIADTTHGLRPDAFWFMEMNTRLQVEHPVTEAILGLDLVELQFRIAAGERLPFSQEDVRMRGHAVEARLYAEDTDNGFLPSPGTLIALRLPVGEGLRVDAGVDGGDEITSFYDPMIGKIIALGDTRDEALDRLEAALSQTLVVGPRCNVSFLRSLVRAREFREGRFDTGFIERHLEQTQPTSRTLDAEAVAAGLGDLIAAEWRIGAPSGASDDPWASVDEFQLGPPRRTPLAFEADGRAMLAYWSSVGGRTRIEVPEIAIDCFVGTDTSSTEIFADGDRRLVWRESRQTEIRLRQESDWVRSGDESGEGVVVSPMPGRIAKLFVALGDEVAKGQPVAMVEAMKMEHVLQAPSAGRIVALRAVEGEGVGLGDVLVEIDSPGGGAPRKL